METLLADYVFGHDKTLERLSGALTSDQVPQSILITGPPHIGKATLAQTLAKALNCLHENQPPCGACTSCRKAASQNHPDIRIYDPPQETATPEALRIEEIRTLQHELSLRPHESKYRVTVLCDFDRATRSAANALLKTLEEPPPRAILILTAKTTSQLLPTIVSRCQTIQLRPVADNQIAQCLQTYWGASAEDALLLSRLAAGRLGWAVRALENPDMLTQRQQYLADLIDIIRQGEAYRLSYAQAAANNRQNLDGLLNLWLSAWRDMMLIASQSSENMINIDQVDTLSSLASQLNIAQLTAAIQQTYQSLRNLKFNINIRLNIEVLLLNYPTLSASE